ncbi:MAG TPA: hypothetical protein RMH80_30615, partial [Polyangiaceae bacterium LLY-WYZ-15_(1-7)]|nr:hypothetical protein [Polyangiaceae bacterium LLY-WYZ-15_(1-7)]
ARDQHLDPRWVRTQLRRKDWVMQALTNFGDLFSGAAAEMQKRGTYFRGNTGEFRLKGRKSFGVMEEIGKKRSRREVNARNEEIFQKTQAMVAQALDGDGELVEWLMSGSRELYDAWKQLSA